MIFWPLLLGTVVFLAASKGGELTSSVVVGICTALFTLGMVYASDKGRRYATAMRILIALISISMSIYWLAQQDLARYIATPLFLLVVALVLFHQDIKSKRDKRKTVAESA